MLGLTRIFYMDKMEQKGKGNRKMRRKIFCCSKDFCEEMEEEIVEEAPLFLTLNNSIKRVLLRTPGEDEALLTGMCFTEGFIKNKGDLVSMHIEDDLAEMEVRLNRRFPEPKKISDIFDEILGLSLEKDKDRSISVEELLRCMDVMESMQDLREKTKASHAAMLFSYELKPICMSEDVGRHNALDKVIGKSLLSNRLGDVFVATLSSRISFEMARKAVIAGIKVLMGISRPTSMAILLGDKAGMSIVTLAKEGGIMVFSGKERIKT